MKSLEERRAQRKADREELTEREKFDHAEFLRKGGAEGEGSSTVTEHPTNSYSTEGGGNHGGAAERKDKSSQGEGGGGGGAGMRDGDTGKANAAGQGGDSTGGTQGQAAKANTPGKAPEEKPKSDAAKARDRDAAGKQGQGWGDPGVGTNVGETGGKRSNNPET